MKLLFTCEDPRIAYFADVLTDIECDHLIGLGEPMLEPSKVIGVNAANSVLNPQRTSWGCALRFAHDPVVLTIESRIAYITATRLANGEALQITRYHPGEFYAPHYDYFNPEESGPADHLQYGGQRTHTVILYLTDAFDHGYTEFPELNLHFHPRRGGMLVFCNTTEDGAIDPRTKHGGYPPSCGTKIIATKWIRENAVQLGAHNG